jgi:hypothetical protein
MSPLEPRKQSCRLARWAPAAIVVAGLYHSLTETDAGTSVLDEIVAGLVLQMR